MRTLLLVMFIGGSFLTFSAAAIAEEPEAFNIERIHQQFQVQEREMELEQRRREMDYENQMREMELQKQRAQLEAMQHKFHKDKDKFAPLLLICLVVHILVAVWIFQDIRTRAAGSGLWIVIALLAGLLGALVYAVVRIGDMKKP